MRKWAVFFLVFAVTFVTRVYGVASESVWYDEAALISLIDGPSIIDYLNDGRAVDKLKVPLYPALEYIWWHNVSPTVLGLRWTSIFTALATVTLLYWCSLRFWGIWIAASASLFFALSRLFIYFGQEIRMYGLMYLFALAAWFALYVAVRGGKRSAWTLNALMNLLMVQTHLVGAFSIGAQFLFLIWERPLHWRKLAAWTVVHAFITLSLVPWFLWMAAYKESMSWIPYPTFVTLLETFFFAFPGASFPPDYPLPVSPMIPLVIMAVLAAALALIGIRAMWRSDDGGKTTVRMLLCWMIAPFLMMFVMSYLYIPCYVDRYALYAAFPFFIFVGKGLLAMRPAPRWAAALALWAFCVVNFYAIERPVRPDFASAVDLVKFHGAPTDRVVTRGMGYEFCLQVYFPNAEARHVSHKVPIRRSIRDAAQGQPTWFILDPFSKDFTRWTTAFDDAVAAGTVRMKQKEIIGGPRPIHVFYVTPNL
jgi:hypothetical protein